MTSSNLSPRSSVSLPKEFERRRLSHSVTLRRESLHGPETVGTTILPKLSPATRRHSVPITSLGSTTQPLRKASGGTASNGDLHEIAMKALLEQKEKRLRIQQERNRGESIMPHRRKVSIPSIDEILPSIGETSGKIPQNSTRRVLQRNSSVYRIHKFLADIKDNLPTEVQLEIEDLKRTNSQMSDLQRGHIVHDPMSYTTINMSNKQSIHDSICIYYCKLI